MRKLWFRRRGVETIIGGMIVLVLFLFSLVAMMVVSQQYDTYQVSAATMQRRDADRFAENLEGVFPGLQPADPPVLNQTQCSGSYCNAYFIIVANLGIGTQISRIYINSTQPPGCTRPCILDPSNRAAPNRFLASDAYINQGEMNHIVLFWLPWDQSQGTETLTNSCIIGGVLVNYNCHIVTIVTNRGRVFSFQFPFSPQTSSSAVGAGGTGIYIGPLVYTFQRPMITYTNSNVLVPPIPIGGTNGYWSLPTGAMIIYVKLQTDVGVVNDVYLTTQSILELLLYTPSGSVDSFYIIAPITQSFCLQAFKTKDPTINCDTTYGYSLPTCSPSYMCGNTGNPSNIVNYYPCPAGPNNYNSNYCSTTYHVGPRYRIPKPNAAQLDAKERGDPVIVAFAASGPCQSSSKCTGVPIQTIQGAWAGKSATTFLGLTYVWDDGKGTGSYIYGVTLPFVAVCIQTSINVGGKCQG
jgi:hypothetical protein